MSRLNQATPWRAEGKRILSSRGDVIGETRSVASALRIAAAANAVDGIPTAILEDGFIQRLIWRRLERVLSENPELEPPLEPDSPDSVH